MEELLKLDRLLPVLILLYASIDGVSNLSTIGKSKGRKTFKDWVTKWMLTERPHLRCNAADLYAARCGILHRQTAQFDQEGKEDAIEIYYNVGEATPGPIYQVAKERGQNIVVVNVEDLISAFKMGMLACFEAIGKNENWKTEFDKKAMHFLAYIRYVE